MSKKQSKANKRTEAQPKKNVDIRRKFLKPQVIRFGVLALISLVIILASLYWIPGDMQYRITETYQFSSNDPGLLSLVVLLPTSVQNQEVFEPEIAWLGSMDIRRDGQLRVIRLDGEIEAGETVEAVISYEVHLWQGSEAWHGEPPTPEDLSSSALVDVDHPEIVARAKLLQVAENPKQTARNIYDFAGKYLDLPEGGQSDPDISASEALESGIGGHVEYAYLMAALSRAAEIPARVVNGFVLPDTFPFIPVSATKGHPAEAHSWVDVFYNHTWHFADPGLGNRRLKHDLFGWVDGRHLAYAEMQVESYVLSQWVSDTEETGDWHAAMSSPLRFVAWTDTPFESIEFIPRVTVRKTWDSRYFLMFSMILIL